MKVKGSRRRLVLRCLSFGMLGLSLAALILARNGAFDRLLMILLPLNAWYGISPRLLLLGIAIASLGGCIAAELMLRRGSGK
jgi:hypothetical protein